MISPLSRDIAAKRGLRLGQTKAKNLAVYGNLTGTGNPLIAGWSTSNVTISTDPLGCAAGYTTISVSATIPYTSIIAGMFCSNWIGACTNFGSFNIPTQHEEPSIGQ